MRKIRLESVNSSHVIYPLNLINPVADSQMCSDGGSVLFPKRLEGWDIACTAWRLQYVPGPVFIFCLCGERELSCVQGTKSLLPTCVSV